MSFASSRLLSNSITISREIAGEGDLISFRDVEMTKAAIIPFDDKDASLGENAQGQEHAIYVAFKTNIETGDRITDEDGLIYTVDGISRIKYGSERNWHLRVSANRQRELEDV